MEYAIVEFNLDNFWLDDSKSPLSRKQVLSSVSDFSANKCFCRLNKSIGQNDFPGLDFYSYKQYGIFGNKFYHSSRFRIFFISSTSFRFRFKYFSYPCIPETFISLSVYTIILVLHLGFVNYTVMQASFHIEYVINVIYSIFYGSVNVSILYHIGYI